MSRRRIVGVLIAAGRGRRMGRTKQFVLWPTLAGDVPLVVAAFDTIATICDAMIVVVDTDASRVQAALAPRECLLVTGRADGQMFDSVLAGLGTAAATYPGHDVLLQLGDHPELGGETRMQLIEQANSHPGKAIIPEFDGRGGHPIVVPSSIVGKLLDARPTAGLREVWHRCPALCHRFPVTDPSVVLDIDTPDQLR